MPLTVSTVIPAYNSAKTLPRAIESALRQSVETRVIVVDDGSTDDTHDVLRRCGAGVRVISQKNAGAGAARSVGTKLADTDLIAYLDADDAWHPEKLERQIAVFSDPEVGLSSTASQWIDGNGDIIRISRPELHGYVTDRLILRNPIVTSSVVVRRTFIQRMSPLFRPDLFPVEDWELWIRLSSICKVSVSPEVLVDYYVLDSSGSRTRSAEEFRRLYEGMFEGLRHEPNLGHLITSKRREIAARIHSMVADMYYEDCNYVAFWKDILQSIALAPVSHPWFNTLPMLLLPKSLRELFRRRVAQARARRAHDPILEELGPRG